MTIPLLEITDLTKNFGGLAALTGVEMKIEPGKLNAIIGPNGAGKTTLFNVISGMIRPTSGVVRFMGENIVGRAPHEIARLGLSRTLQIKSVFNSMTVRENIWMAAQVRHGVLKPFRSWKTQKKTREETETIIEDLGLARIADQEAGTLAYGDVAVLEIGIALASEPKMLLLDEPICGMSPAETELVVSKIQEISKYVTVVIIEHDMEVVFNIADHVVVMAQGRVLSEGTAAHVIADPEVRSAYLGDDDVD